jgi:leucyl-tRNA synthetase
MPIQAAAFRLKREITSGNIHKNCQCAHASPDKKCPCPKAPKSKDPKAAAPECTCASSTQYEILQ